MENYRADRLFPDRQVVVVKLGGSVITDKSTVDTFCSEAAIRLASELKFASGPLVIVHGAGSFGKPLAIKYDLLSGILGPDHPEIATLAQQKDRQLHSLVLDALIGQGLHVTSLPPSAIFHCQGREVKAVHRQALIRHLRVGLIPVVHSDMVVDDVHGFSVLSSDDVVWALCSSLHARQAIFVCDVDGVHENHVDPVQTTRLVREFGGVVPITYADDVLDVSGGMRSKVAVAQKIANEGTECWIVNGRVEGRLGALLRGDQVIGTRFPPAQVVPGTPAIADLQV